MDRFEKLFIHLPDYKVVVCKQCRFAVIPAQAKSHIVKRHSSITRTECQQIMQTITTLRDVAQEPDEIQYPNAESQPISVLPVFQDGLRCTAEIAGGICNYICRERKGMAMHCRRQHSWTNPRKRGRCPRTHQSANEQTPCPWTTEQPCQRFFKTGTWQRYFPVQADGEQSSDHEQWSAISSEQVARQGRAILDGVFEGFERGRQNDRNDQRRRYEPNPWLEHTGWEGHLGPYKAWAVQMTRPDKTVGSVDGEGERDNDEANDEATAAINASEEALEQACKATRSLIRRSYQVSRIEIVGRPAMHYINRRETGAPNSDRPFYGKQKVQTIRKYTERFIAILRYIWRTETVNKRPKYRLTSTQRKVLAELRGLAAKVAAGEESRPRSAPEQHIDRQARRRERLINRCSSFWIAMFDHRLGDEEYESAVLSGLAVLGADGEGGGWVPAINYTPTLAAIITTMRAIVIRRAWRMRRNQIQANIRNGITEEHAHEEVASVFDIVKGDVERFMTMTEFGGHPTPINTVYTHKMYGMKIRYTTKAEGQISWEGDDTVLVRKIKFSMGDVRSVVHGLLAAARQQLIELVMLPPNHNSHEWKPSELPRFDMSKISDNHRVMDSDWSFMKDVRNEWAVCGDRWMGMRMFEDTKVRQRFVRKQSGESIEWNTDAVVRFLREVKKLKEKGIVLKHMSGGAPGRSTELISIQCENGRDARSQRGVFMDNGMLSFVPSYHKGFSASQSMKIVHRFVPQEVGEIFIYYLWLIRPFERILQGLVQGQNTFSSWLWEPEPEEEWMEGDEDMDDQDEGYESAEDEQHNAATTDEWDEVAGDEVAEVVRKSHPKPDPRNCDGFWNTDRVRRVMRRETANLIGVPIGISDWRQVYPAIHRELATDHGIRATLTKIYDNPNPHAKAEETSIESQASIFRAKQSGHSPQMEEDIYGRLLEQSPFTTIAEKDAFRRVSVDCHRFLQFPSAFQMDSVDPDIRRRIKQEQDDMRFHRFQRMRNIDVQAELQRMYRNPRATFRGAQREALDLIVGGCPRAVIIIRTGGGKSLLFMLPAAASKGGVTIVVVPKIALQTNMKARCHDAGIKCAVWSEDRAPPYDAQIVFVIAESAVSQSFADFINSKRGTHQLERIVIDECHTILQSNEHWRPKVLELRELAGRDTQIVCLTATLPPQKQDEFLEKMDMRVDGLQILRDVTIRPNIAYSVEEYDAEDEVGFLRGLVEQKKAQYPASDKIVIYCRKIEQVKQFAKELDCTAFWRTAGTEQEKEEILEKLTNGEERVFTSTNALGEGIDAPGIRVVIHIGIVDSLDDYGQQSGRAGRDGHTASEAIILRKVMTGRDGRRRPEQGWKVEPKMTEFLSGKVCKRVVMDRYMDGDMDRTTCRRGEQFCDVCRGRGSKRVRVVNEQDEPVAKRVRRSRNQRVEWQENDEYVGLEEADEQAEDQARQRAEWQAEQASQAEQQARQQFDRERRQFAAIDTQRRESRIEQGQVVDKMDALFGEWKYGCSVCRIRGRPSNTGHNWRACPHEKVEVGIIEEIRSGLCQVRWGNGWMCCKQCWAPQAICHSYEPVDSTGRMRFQKVDRRCQYKGVLLEAVSVSLAARNDCGSIVEWVHEQADQAGITVQQTSGDRDDIANAWFATGVKQGNVEMSGMCYLFYCWAWRSAAVE